MRVWGLRHFGLSRQRRGFQLIPKSAFLNLQKKAQKMELARCDQSAQPAPTRLVRRGCAHCAEDVPFFCRLAQRSTVRFGHCRVGGWPLARMATLHHPNGDSRRGGGQAGRESDLGMVVVLASSQHEPRFRHH